MTILICGEALYDLFQLGEPEPGRLTLDARAGGSPFNVAIGLARLGAPSALLTGLSTDLLGERLAQHLVREGVRTDYLVRSGRRTTISLVGLDAAGAPSYAFYGVGSADTALTEADLPAIGDEVEALHFGSYSIAVQPAADAYAALAARYADRFISLDPNIRPTIQPDMAVWTQRIEALLPKVDLIKVSIEDLEVLDPSTPPNEIARGWAVRGPGLVVVTDGGGAATAFWGEKVLTVQPPEIDVADTVGAGDTFQASLLAELSRLGALSGDALAALPEAAVRELLAFAARAAAICCTRRGANPPTRDEVLSWRSA